MIEVKIKIENVNEIVDAIKDAINEFVMQKINETLEKHLNLDLIENQVINEPPALLNPPSSQATLTRDKVREAFISKNSPANKAKLKALLEKYHATNISQLDEKYFEDIMKDLEAL